MGALAKLRALTGAEKRVLFASAVALPAVRLGLALAGFASTKSTLARFSRPRVVGPIPVPAATTRALSVARMVAIAAGSGPIRAACLPRSLWLWAVLRREGIETTLRVGVNRDEGVLHAHAWVEHRGRPLIDSEDVAIRFPCFEEDFGVSTARTS